jgi:hypothetical protein
MDKIFAKPFLGSLIGHSDAVAVIAKSLHIPTNFISGSYDGEIM